VTINNTVSPSTLVKLFTLLILIGGVVFAGGILYAQTDDNTEDIAKNVVDITKNSTAITETDMVLGRIELQFKYIERAQTEQKQMLRKVLSKLEDSPR